MNDIIIMNAYDVSMDAQKETKYGTLFGGCVRNNREAVSNDVFIYALR